MNQWAYIHLYLPLLLRQHSVDIGRRRPPQGVGVHLVPSPARPHGLLVPLDQSLSSDQHDPRLQGEKAHVNKKKG